MREEGSLCGAKQRDTALGNKEEASRLVDLWETAVSNADQQNKQLKVQDWDGCIEALIDRPDRKEVPSKRSQIERWEEDWRGDLKCYLSCHRW